MSTSSLSADGLNVFVIFSKMYDISYHYLKSRTIAPKGIGDRQRALQINEKAELRDSNPCPHLI